MAVNIALLTWNVGNSKFTAQDLTIISKALLADSKPELIILGLQEAKDSLGAALTKGPLKGYTLAAEEGTWGMTKLTEGISNIFTEVLVSDSVKAKLKPYGTKVAKDVFFKLKGSVCIAFEYDGIKFGVAGAHLDASDKGARQTAFKASVKALQQLKANCLFILGDLNYRIPVADGTAVSAKTTADELCAMLVDAKKRATLFTKLDPIGMDGPDGGAGYLYPPPLNAKGEVSYPTYKRHAKGIAAFAAKQTKENALALYFGDAQSSALAASTKRKGECEIGWLDRVGVSLPSGGTFSPDFSEALIEVPTSDHAPFLLKGRCS